MADRFSFPNGYHLLTATHSSALTWNQADLTPIFSSGSAGGILAAEKAANDTGLLAIVDGQVVILHDVQRGRDKNYCFKGTEVRRNPTPPILPRLANPLLQHDPSVQTYSSPQHTLLSPTHTYPSSPTVLAISATALLSASTRCQPSASPPSPPPPRPPIPLPRPLPPSTL
ncbi:hypothetical protein V2W45_1339516 [Cenococcum geophilum]